MSEKVYTKETHPKLFEAIKELCSKNDGKPFKLPDNRGKVPK